MLRVATIGVVLAAMSLGTPAQGGDIAGWKHNPASAYDGAGVPVDWSDAGHQAWSTPMPAKANSTPLVIDGRVLTTAEPFQLICVDAETGNVLWQHDHSADEALAASGEHQAMTEAQKLVFEQKQNRIAELDREARGLFRQARRDPDARARLDVIQAEASELKSEIGPQLAAAGVVPVTHDTNGYASPSPATDGEHVYVFFGNGVAASYDLEGNRRWITIAQIPTHRWGVSATPQLVDGVVVVLVDDLIGLDAQTGEELWRVKQQHSFGSPTVGDLGHGPFIITPKGLFVDPRDGRELGGVADVELEYNVPLFVDGTVYFIYEKAIAFTLTQDADGDINATELWQASIRGDRHYASPVIHDGLIYAVSRREDVTVLKMQTGEVVHESKAGLDIRGSMYGSPVIVSGRVYYPAEDGRIQTYKIGADGEKAEQITLSAFRSTPVITGDRIYIRTYDALVCIASD